MRSILITLLLGLGPAALPGQQVSETKAPQVAPLEWKATEVRNLELTVISGDPNSAEPVVLRLRALREVRMPPHWHAASEDLTPLHGTIALGFGDKFDPKTMRLLQLNKVMSIGAKDRHFVLFQAGAEAEVKTQGPVVTEWVDPSSIKNAMKEVDSLSDRSKKKAAEDNP